MVTEYIIFAVMYPSDTGRASELMLGGGEEIDFPTVRNGGCLQRQSPPRSHAVNLPSLNGIILTYISASFADTFTVTGLRFHSFTPHGRGEAFHFT